MEPTRCHSAVVRIRSTKRSRIGATSLQEFANMSVVYLKHDLTIDSTLFPIPITLAVVTFAGLEKGKDIALRNAQNELIAVMTLEEIYSWDPAREDSQVLGST